MEPNLGESLGQGDPNKISNLLSVSLPKTSIALYILTEDKLENLTYVNSTAGVHLAVAAACFGAFATFLTSLLTAASASAMANAVFKVGAVFSALGLVISGFLFHSGFARAKADVAKVKEHKLTKDFGVSA